MPEENQSAVAPVPAASHPDAGQLPALRGEGLTKRYSGVTVVDQVDIAARPGVIRAVIGENGAGKSTTMRMVTGFIPPSEGRVSVGGHDLVEQPLPAKRLIFKCAKIGWV